MEVQKVNSAVDALQVLHVYEYCREKKLCVFLSGDYEFECILYGLTGAQGNQDIVYLFHVPEYVYFILP